MHKPRLGEINLGQATTQIQVVTLCGKTTIDGTGTDGDEDFAVLAELAQHVHVLRVADAAFDQTDVARPAMFDVGQWRTVELDKF